MKYWQEEIETMPHEKIEELQTERLIKQVGRVYDNVELYRNRMDAAGVKPSDIKSLDDITKLPFTCKQDLRDTYPYGMFAVSLDEVVRLHASSGTTGKQICGMIYVRANLLRRVLTKQAKSTFPTATDFLRAAWDFTAARPNSAQP